MRTIDRLLARTLAAGVLACLFAGGAQAVPIAAGSEISLAGADSFTPTSITFTGLADLLGTSGSFNSLTTCVTCVSMIGTLTSGSTGSLYALTQGALSTDLKLKPPATFIPGGTALLPTLTVTGSGTLDLTGFDPGTPGVYEVTTQGPHGAKVSFSTTAVPVPEPGALGLLAVGMAGLFLMRHKWRKG